MNAFVVMNKNVHPTCIKKILMKHDVRKTYCLKCIEPLLNSLERLHVHICTCIIMVDFIS